MHSEKSLYKPVYIKNREIQNDSNNRVTGFELYKANKGKQGITSYVFN